MQMQLTMPKLKILVRNGLYCITHQVLEQQKIIFQQILCKKPTELQNIKRSSFMKDVNT